MLTSSGQKRQLVNGFANRVQRQKAISDNAYGFWEGFGESCSTPQYEFRGLRPPRYQ